MTLLIALNVVLAAATVAGIVRLLAHGIITDRHLHTAHHTGVQEPESEQIAA
jgi:hypothetical protein